jgi:threonine 3-dehydrogenase
MASTAIAMKAVRKTREGPGAELVELALPSVGPREVLVKIELAAICGSDKHTYEWDSPTTRGSLTKPFTMGHEFAGRVLEIGSRITALKPGDLVAGETHQPCGRCETCLTGNAHICPNTRLVGRHIDGCFAEYCVLPEACARRVPESIPLEQAALLEPVGVAVHAITDLEVSGKSLAVLGAGPIGLMSVAVGRALGATRIFATARSRSKREKAIAMGATAVFDPRTEDVVQGVLEATAGVGVGTVVDYTGDPEAIVQAFRMLRPAGRIVLVARFTGPLPAIVGSYFINKSPQVFGLWGRRLFETWLLAEDLLTSGKVDLAPVVGRTYLLADFEAAFQDSITDGASKVLLAP